MPGLESLLEGAILGQPGPSKADPRWGSMKPLAPEAFGEREARHLVWRAGFGGTAQQIKTLAGWGPTKAVDHLLSFGEIDFEPPSESTFDANILRPATADERRMVQMARRSQDEEVLAKARLMQQDRERLDRDQVREIQRWWLLRMIRTPKPLEEKLTLFWHGHFATSYRTIENSYHMFLQNQLFRRHAAGNFGDLLFAIIRDPAMLAYLDNNDSKKTKPNENLARELMELFGLGVGHYTEKDIKEGARALTGYSFDDDRFVLRTNDHDVGGKSILGVSGNLDGDDFVKAILGKRQCAKFITRKLFRAFAADLPLDEKTWDAGTRQAVDDLTSTLLSARYNLKPMLRELFLSEHFYHPRVMGEQIKSPVQLIVGAMRTLGTPLRDAGVLLDALDLMGQDLLFPPSVKGWDGGRSWINTSTLYVRQNILAFLLTGKRPKGYDPLAKLEPFDPLPLASALGLSSGGEKTIDALLAYTLGRAPESAKSALRDVLGSADGQLDAKTLTNLLLVITAMPEYQLC
jgi:uncharacterized protein (DUF1800 family)